MPFLGKDWRANGDVWVRTDHGWETLKNWRVKVHENINYEVLQRLLRQSVSQNARSYDIDCPPRQLYIHVPKVSSSHIAQSDVMFTQAISALDMTGSLKDRRRVNYMYKLIELLVEERLTDLSGGVQIQLLSLLDHAVAAADAQHKRQLVKLLETLLHSLEEYKYHFRHVGCDQLWAKHYSDTQRLLNMAQNVNCNVELENVEENGIMTLPDLPVDILRQILLHLSSHEDLINMGKSSHDMENLVCDGLLWRDLCFYHFTETQIYSYLCPSSAESKENINNHLLMKLQKKDSDWYQIYQKLFKRYGHRKEEYSDMLAWCDNCSVMFWKIAGHPCKFEKSHCTLVTPKEFVEKFHV